MAKQTVRKNKKNEEKRKPLKDLCVSETERKREISLKESISNLENSLLADEIKDNNRAKEAIKKTIEGLKLRLKKG